MKRRDRPRAPGVPHANPGIYPDGKNKITVLLDHWTLEPGIGPPGPQVAYVYHLDQAHQWGEQFYPSGQIQPGTNMHRKLFGEAFVPRPDFTPRPGRWICQELMVDAGTPGGRDGRVAFWSDGRLAADFPNLRFRTDSALLPGRVDLGCYESRNNGVHRVRFDDDVAATAYIGPLTKEADLRSEAGMVVGAGAVGKLGELRKRFKVRTFAKQECLVAEFPMRHALSVYVGIVKVYPALARAAKQAGVEPRASLELYTMGKTILYAMPLR